jgi:FkbM family methyltransferase
MKEIKYKDVNIYIPDRYINQNLLNRFKNGSYESEELNMIRKYYDKNDFCLEIGSCLGFTTSILSKKVNSVISVEANPELIDSLNKCKLENKLDNVKFINKYISESREFVDFQTYDLIVAGSGDRLDNAKEWSDTKKVYKVECIRAKDIEDINNVNSLVIDCEGGELSFLNENLDLLKQIRKITIELHGFLMNDNQYDKKCVDLLKNQGFKIKDRIGNTYHLEK